MTSRIYIKKEGKEYTQGNPPEKVRQLLASGATHVIQRKNGEVVPISTIDDVSDTDPMKEALREALMDTVDAVNVEDYTQNEPPTFTQDYILADGTKWIEGMTTNKYDSHARKKLMDTTVDALKKDWDVEWGSDVGAGFTAQEGNYIDDAYDEDFYRFLVRKKNKEYSSNAEKMVQLLTVSWLLEQSRRKSVRFGKEGGGWSCGQTSGVWADFLLQIKVRDDFQGYCPRRAFFVGIRLHAKVLPEGLQLLNPLWKPSFTIVKTDFFYEPENSGMTTVMFPNYGNPYVCEEVKNCLKAFEEARKEAKKEAKRWAIAQATEESRERDRLHRERLEAERMEAMIDETVVAYNAQVKRTKDLIAFNRQHIADPLTKRIDAKEAERQREVAERRHAEKLQQKEAERLARFAPAFKSKTK